MPIEIRELIIKTTIDSENKTPPATQEEVNNTTLSRLRRQLLEECKTYINEKVNAEKER